MEGHGSSRPGFRQCFDDGPARAAGVHAGQRMIPHGATWVGVEATIWNALIEILELRAYVLRVIAFTTCLLHRLRGNWRWRFYGPK